MCPILTCTGIMAATVCSATAPYFWEYTCKRRNQGNAGLDSVLCSVHRRDQSYSERSLISPDDIATLQDRMLMREGKRQDILRS